MDNKIEKTDQMLAEAASMIGHRTGADASAIIILKGDGSRIYVGAPGKGEPTKEEASKVLRKMGEAFSQESRPGGIRRNIQRSQRRGQARLVPELKGPP